MYSNRLTLILIIIPFLVIKFCVNYRREIITRVWKRSPYFLNLIIFAILRYFLVNDVKNLNDVKTTFYKMAPAPKFLLF